MTLYLLLWNFKKSIFITLSITYHASMNKLQSLESLIIKTPLKSMLQAAFEIILFTRPMNIFRRNENAYGLQRKKSEISKEEAIGG